MHNVKLSKYDYLVHKAIESAENKHPEFPDDPVGMTSIMMEEAGEAAREANKIVYDKDGNIEDLKKEVLHTACVCYRILEAIDKLKYDSSTRKFLDGLSSVAQDIREDVDKLRNVPNTREVLDDVYYVAKDIRGTECMGVPQYLRQVDEGCWQLSSISGATELTPEELKRVRMGGSISGFDELKAVRVSKLYKVEES